METTVRLSDCPLSPRKMRLMADLIRGMEADKALYILKVHPKKMYSIYLEKLIKAGISSWKEKNPDENVESAGLFIKTIMIDGGKVLKRMQPAPQGRAYRVRKRSNHIKLTIADNVVVANNVNEGETVSNDVN